MMEFEKKKNNLKEKITAILFICVIFGMLAGMLLSWKDIQEDFLIDYRTSVKPGTPYISRVVGAVKSFERTVNEKTCKRNDFIEIYGLTQKTMGKRIITDAGYGELYKTKYNQITFSVDKKNVTGELENMKKLKSELDQAGIPLLYIQAPFKLPYGEQQLPQNVNDHANENANQFLKGLKEAGIDYLDLRSGFWSSGMNQNQLFFDTDHHWTIDGAFYSFGDIVKKLNKDYILNINEKYTDITNYQKKTYHDFYIGSMGRRVGRTYGGIDDFALITPDFKTSYTVYERDYGGEKEFKGSFETAVLVSQFMDENASPDTNRYAVYHGDNAELEFNNHLIDNDTKILMVKDSFALPVYSFLSLAVREVRALDVRLYQGSVAEYAKKNRPDVVIILYNADCFGSNLFDFEDRQKL